MKTLAHFLTELSQKLLGEKCTVFPADNEPDNLLLIEKAKQDWLAALALFNNVSEKELIDHAIFNLNAAERRYVFLLKEARQEIESKKTDHGKEETLEKENHV